MLPQWVMAQAGFGIRAIATAASNASILDWMGGRRKMGMYHAIKRGNQHDTCSASFHGVMLTYVQNYKVNTQGICANLMKINDHSRLKRGQVAFTFVREPLGRFSSGFSEISWRNVRDHKLPDRGCANYRSHRSNTQARALAFVEDTVGGKLGKHDNHKAGGCSLIEEDLHVAPQVGYIYNALTEPWLDEAGKRLSFVGRLEQMDVHWEALGRLVLRKVGDGAAQGVTWPPYRSDLWAVPWFPNRNTNPHEATNAASDNRARQNMDELIGSGHGDNQNHAESLAERPDAQLALCRIYLPDYVCFGYELPEACAAIIGSQHGISCPWPWMPVALDAATAPENAPIVDDLRVLLDAPSSTCAAYC